MTWQEEGLKLYELTAETQLLILKHVDFDELLFMDYVVKPPKPYNE